MQETYQFSIKLPKFWSVVSDSNGISAVLEMVLHLFHSIHAIQELVCDRVQLQQIHTVEGSLQQLKDSRELKRSNDSSIRIQVVCNISDKSIR